MAGNWISGIYPDDLSRWTTLHLMTQWDLSYGVWEKFFLPHRSGHWGFSKLPKISGWSTPIKINGNWVSGSLRWHWILSQNEHLVTSILHILASFKLIVPGLVLIFHCSQLVKIFMKSSSASLEDWLGGSFSLVTGNPILVFRFIQDGPLSDHPLTSFGWCKLEQLSPGMLHWPMVWPVETFSSCSLILLLIFFSFLVLFSPSSFLTLIMCTLERKIVMWVSL